MSVASGPVAVSTPSTNTNNATDPREGVHEGTELDTDAPRAGAVEEESGDCTGTPVQERKKTA